jgi:hypothetical protein
MNHLQGPTLSRAFPPSAQTRCARVGCERDISSSISILTLISISLDAPATWVLASTLIIALRLS